MRKAFVIVVVLSLMCIIVFALVQAQETRLTLDISSLSLNQAKIPERWKCYRCEGEIITDWDYRELESNNNINSILLDNSSKYNDGKTFQWIDKENGYIIDTAIIDYKIPVVAQINFLLNDPKGRLKKVFWNYTYAKENIVPPNWDWNNHKADEVAVRCGDGTQEQCTGWFYQARYGQYYLIIYFRQNLDYRTFAEIAIAINETFLSHLE